MNCKPGDMAVIVRGQHVGRIVEVLKWGPSRNVETPEGWWVYSSSVIGTVDGRFENVVVYADSWLRPIRPTDGEDETLQWAGKPNEVTA